MRSIRTKGHVVIAEKKRESRRFGGSTNHIEGGDAHIHVKNANHNNYPDVFRGANQHLTVNINQEERGYGKMFQGTTGRVSRG